MPALVTDCWRTLTDVSSIDSDCGSFATSVFSSDDFARSITVAEGLTHKLDFPICTEGSVGFPLARPAVLDRAETFQISVSGVVCEKPDPQDAAS